MEPLLVIGACCSIPAAFGAVVLAVAGKDEGVKKVRSFRARLAERFSRWTLLFRRDRAERLQGESSKVGLDQ